MSLRLQNNLLLYISLELIQYLFTLFQVRAYRRRKTYFKSIIDGLLIMLEALHEFIEVNRTDVFAFIELKSAFSSLFPKVEFDVFPKSNGTDNDQFYIKIYEDSKEYELEESASGYFEALILLSHIGTRQEDILIIDEPALHLHTIKIKHLGRISLFHAKRQIILITHSPYFGDISLFEERRRLISIQRGIDGISKISNNLEKLRLDLKPYHFRPEIFFSKCATVM